VTGNLVFYLKTADTFITVISKWYVVCIKEPVFEELSEENIDTHNFSRAKNKYINTSILFSMTQ
jgi:hypothetical protein